MSNLIQHAIAILREGGLVGLPTETVYGLAADAQNPEAVAKVFAVKGRPADHPLIVHIGTLAELEHWAQEIPAIAYQLTERFWPGPLTVVLKKQMHVLDAVTGGQDTVAIRMPAHPIALELLRIFGSGLVAPSANQFGRISPTEASAVLAELGQKVDLVLPGGQSEVGIESTIVALHEHPFTILRQGMINQAELEAFTGESFCLPNAKTTIRAPGLLAAHYAPRSPLKLFALSEFDQIVKNGPAKSFIVLARHPAPINLNPNIEWWKMPENPAEYAHVLYAQLRRADALQPDLILVETPSPTPDWAAIQDRLNRAAHP